MKIVYLHGEEKSLIVCNLVDVIELAAPLLHALHVRHDPAVLSPEQDCYDKRYLWIYAVHMSCPNLTTRLRITPLWSAMSALSLCLVL